MPGIIVGYDGSSCAREALRWALREALLRAAPLTVLGAIEPRQLPSPPSLWAEAVYAEPDQIEIQAVEQAMAQAVEEATVELADQDRQDSTPTVTVRAVVGRAEQVLTDASQEADLLVVGSRGHNPVERLLLGSVSTFLVHHADCPVTVVRP